MLGDWVAQVVPSDPDEADRYLLHSYVVQIGGQVLAYGIVLAVGLYLLHRRKVRRAQTGPTGTPASNWYPDPWNPYYERWWNGDRWTGDVRPAPWPGSSPWDHQP